MVFSQIHWLKADPLVQSLPQEETRSKFFFVAGYVKKGSEVIVTQSFTSNTVDGWNPAPPGMYETL